MSFSDGLDASLQYLKGVGPRRAVDLLNAGLTTVGDLLYRFPTRYEDRGQFQTVLELREGKTAAIAGTILNSHIRSTRRPQFKIFELLVEDSTGAVRATWFNQAFLSEILKPRQRVILFGKVETRSRGGGLQFVNPHYELLKSEINESVVALETIHAGRIVPVYERSGKITTKMYRRFVHEALQRLPETLEDGLPPDLQRRLQLPAVRQALEQVHFPEKGTSIELLNRFRTPAQQRIIFEEFFCFQLGLATNRMELIPDRKEEAMQVNDRTRRAALEVLPFRLTSGQKHALQEIAHDLQRFQAMNRLLQGDVGSGKTIVALLSAVIAMENGFQVAFMAPTELLAAQHAKNLNHLLAKSRFSTGLLTGSMQAKDRRRIITQISKKQIDLVVGTQALLENPIKFHRLGLVVIDEQHRFGVVQRARLREKGLSPHVLVMTATPIPRTLALTAYGDLDVSVIKDLPPGRKPVTTIVKPSSKHEEVYRFVGKELAAGRQAYVVYPLVEQSSKMDLKAATEMADHLATKVFSKYRVTLIHGRLSQAVKDEAMSTFVRGECNVLVSTTVIEVGVDVPNATIMVIEHAERFGLAQLHQLRGRVGRGEEQAYCILLYRAPLGEVAAERLRSLNETTDGFELAERDLKLRGPGDFFGTRQSGVPTLRVGDLIRDYEIMEQARIESTAWLKTASRDHILVKNMRKAWSERFGLVKIG